MRTYYMNRLYFRTLIVPLKYIKNFLTNKKNVPIHHDDDLNVDVIVLISFSIFFWTFSHNGRERHYYVFSMTLRPNNKNLSFPFDFRKNRFSSENDFKWASFLRNHR